VDFSQSYFELFGLAEGFEVDLKALSSRYQSLQKALHPDKFVNAAERERRISLQQAAQVNSAFQTLKDPLARARYLLELKGLLVDDEQATIRDIEFLEQQIELREELADIRDASDPLTSLLDFMNQVEQTVKACINKLKKNFAVADVAALQQCQMIVHQLQFLYRLRQEAETLEEELL